MIECSTCGTQLGHLYDDYYNAILILQEKPDSEEFEDTHSLMLFADETLYDAKRGEVEKKFNALTSVHTRSANDGVFLAEKDGWNHANPWTSYINAYYTYIRTIPDDKRGKYSMEAVVAMALLYYKDVTEMTSDDLDERGDHAPRYCCKRMFLCDNSTAPY